MRQRERQYEDREREDEEREREQERENECRDKEELQALLEEEREFEEEAARREEWSKATQEDGRVRMVEVRTQAGPSPWLQLRGRTTTRAIKEEVHREWHTRPENQTLIYRGSELRDGSTVRGTGVTSPYPIVLGTKQKAGGRAGGQRVKRGKGAGRQGKEGTPKQGGQAKKEKGHGIGETDPDPDTPPKGPKRPPDYTPAPQPKKPRQQQRWPKTHKQRNKEWHAAHGNGTEVPQTERGREGGPGGARWELREDPIGEFESTQEEPRQESKQPEDRSEQQEEARKLLEKAWDPEEGEAKEAMPPSIVRRREQILMAYCKKREYEMKHEVERSKRLETDKYCQGKLKAWVKKLKERRRMKHKKREASQRRRVCKDHR